MNSKEHHHLENTIYTIEYIFYFCNLFIDIHMFDRRGAINDIEQSESDCDQFNGLSISNDIIHAENIPELLIYAEVCQEKVYKLFGTCSQFMSIK